MSWRLISVCAVLLFLGGCALNTPSEVAKQCSTSQLPTAYDYQLLDQAYQPVSLQQVAVAVKTADVVFIGEHHRNQASHLLQMRLLAALHHHNVIENRPMQLAMEQFERDQQTMVDDYLKGKIGERYLMDEAPTWKNYQGSYRPMVEYAKQKNIPVIAANAPGDIIRCIGRKGKGYLKKLTAAEKTMIATEPFADVPGYADKFFEFMAHSKPTESKRMKQSYLAQLTRDNTMAESVDKALQQSPRAQVVHLNGSFHSAGHLGTAGALKRLNPALKIVVISPVHIDKLNEFKQENKYKDDFYYLLNRQPKEFVDETYKKKKRKAMFAEANEKAKSCKD